MIDFSLFEKKTGIFFTNKKLLEQAFIHRSYINENKGLGLDHNERLEFLGDAVRPFTIRPHEGRDRTFTQAIEELAHIALHSG